MMILLWPFIVRTKLNVSLGLQIPPPLTVKFTPLFGVPQGPVCVTIDCFMSQSYSNLTNDDSTEAIYGEDKIKRLPGPSDTPPYSQIYPSFWCSPRSCCVTMDCFMFQAYYNLTNDDSTVAIYGEDKMKRLHFVNKKVNKKRSKSVAGDIKTGPGLLP